MNILIKNRKHLLVLISFYFSFSVSSISQSLYPISLEEKISNSPLIVEGKVIEQKSFWNAQHSMIYTSNKIEVYKIFKGGAGIQNTIEILTRGGSVGSEQIEVSDLLTLKNNNVGVFFCFANKANLKSPSTGTLLYDVYSSAQGAIKYNLHSQTASAPFAKYSSIQSELYQSIIKKTGQNFKNLRPDLSIAPPVVNAPQSISISFFSPVLVNAGALLDPTTNLLTITGTGFGNTPGGASAVIFDDADDGLGGNIFTVAYNDPLVVSWTDTQIKIRVPTNAGTGGLLVSDNLGNIAAAPFPLQVICSILTATFNFTGTLYTKESNLMNMNGTGGYTIFYSTNTANSGTDLNADPAKATFQRALTTWKEKAGFNVTEGGTTSNQIINPSDGVNVIMYDNTATGELPVPAGVLALCYSFNTMCGGNPANDQARKTEFDIVIRQTGVSSGLTSFTIGPCPPNSSNPSDYDLETVLLHELGHALNLGHINDPFQGSAIGALNPDKIMNFSIVNSVKRVTPDFSAYAGALYNIIPQGNSYGSCTVTGEMFPLSTISEAKDNCPVFPSTALSAGTTVSFDLVHATSNRFVDPDYTQIRCDAVGTPITNNAYYAFKTNNAGGILSLNVSGYTTTPASLTSCTQFDPSILVTGVRLALYQVNACPAAGTFPAPVNCQVFTANGALTDITGLTANTTYLLYLDGIENTKANFNITFNGTSLPVKLTDFHGKQYDNYNKLYWTTEQVDNVKSIIIQRSADGVTFDPIGEIAASSITHDGNFSDYAPLAKANYYRLVIVNMDDRREYSSTILLKHKGNITISTYPIPAKNVINVDISDAKPGSYLLTLNNTVGQKVQELSTLLTEAKKTITLSTAQLATGIYYLNITDQKGVVVFNTPVVINR